jgi:hypothetical protein
VKDKKGDDMDKAIAPWTPAQIAALERRQRAQHLHPYTCAEHSNVPLVPAGQGWVCAVAGCAYRQDWAHADDAAGAWPPQMF